MSSERLERTQLVLRNNLVLADWPIHFAGACFFVRNDEDVPVRISVYDSDDGVNYDLITLSIWSQAGLPSITVQEQSFVAFLIMTERKYVRLTCEDPEECPEGLFISMCQYPPKPRDYTEYA